MMGRVCFDAIDNDLGSCIKRLVGRYYLDSFHLYKCLDLLSAKERLVEGII